MSHITRQCMDCPIYIYDNDRNFIAETVVTGYGKDEMYLEVTNGLENTPIGKRLRVLVIQPSSVSEFYGKLSSLRQGIYEISIHGEQRRDPRGSPRFSFNIAASINNFIIDSEVVRLPNPIRITILNISSTGLMIESRNFPLTKGTLLNIEFKLRGRDTVILCRIVREPDEYYDSNRYGCQIIFPK